VASARVASGARHLRLVLPRPACAEPLTERGIVEWFVAECHRRWGITRTETTVLLMVARGLDTAQIAHRVGAPPTTVRNHRMYTLDKLGARSSPQAVAMIWPLVVDVFLALDCLDIAQPLIVAAGVVD
jgi:DNA-binding CsgD family transcriptional regulator